MEKDYLLEGNGKVDYIWQKNMDQVIDGAWNVKAIHADKYEIKKENKIRIAVLDSGMDRLTANNITGGINFVPSETDLVGYDATGHGTAVENIILSDGTITESVASKDSGVELFSLKVLDDAYQAPVSRVVEALNWCIDNHIDIINMSFGTLVDSHILRKVVQQVAEAGILMIAVAGYTPGQWQKIKNSNREMEKIWCNLSDWTN